MIKILHIDDNVSHHELTKNQLIRLSDDIVFSNVDSLVAAAESVKNEEYDCILTDEEAFEDGGKGFLEKLREDGISLPLVVLSDLFEEAGKEFKQSAYRDDELTIKIIYCRYDMLIYWIHKLVDQHRRMLLSQESVEGTQKLKDLLTDREYEILELISSGNSNKEIAWELKISYRTVVNHIYNLYQKLGVNSRTEAVRFILGQDKVEDGK